MWVCNTEEVRYQIVSQLDDKKRNNEEFLVMMLSFPMKSPVSSVDIYKNSKNTLPTSRRKEYPSVRKSESEELTQTQTQARTIYKGFTNISRTMVQMSM